VDFFGLAATETLELADEPEAVNRLILETAGVED
jgi:hypothetical protein